MKNEKSLTKGLYNKFCLAFWGLLFLGLIAAVGTGPLALDLARLSIISMVVTGVVRGCRPQKCSFRIFATIELILLGILLTAGILSKNGLVVLVGILAGIILCYIIQARFSGWWIKTPS